MPVRFLKTPIEGVMIIASDRMEDDRGFFCRRFCAREFEQHGLRATVAQENLSFSHRKGTIRGLHYQLPPVAEAKVMRCSRGTILEVVVDLRPESVTFLQSFAIKLMADSYNALYVPERCANGYQALTEGAEAVYSVSAFYSPQQERGLRFDDPTLDLAWIVQPTVVSEKDRNWPLLDDERISQIRKELMA